MHSLLLPAATGYNTNECLYCEMVKRLFVNLCITIALTPCLSLAWIRLCRLFYPTIDFDMNSETIDALVLLADCAFIISCLPMFLILIRRVSSHLMLRLSCYFIIPIALIIMAISFFASRGDFLNDFSLIIAPMLIGLFVHVIVYYRLNLERFSSKLNSAWVTSRK